jgi:hypothetical protein
MTMLRTILLAAAVAAGLTSAPALAGHPRHNDSVSQDPTPPREQERAFEATREGRSMPLPQLSDGVRKGRINLREADLRRHLIADVPVEDADLIETDPLAPRFSVAPATLKTQGIVDFQLDYALNILSRLAPPTNIADGRRLKTTKLAAKS